MIPITLCVILGGIITLFLIAPIMHSRPRTCYFLMLFIPIVSLGGALTIFPIDTAKNTISSPLSTYERAETHIKQGDFSLAINILTQALTEKGENHNISLQLGRAYFAKGLLHAEHNEKSEALKNLKRAQDVSPKDAPFLDDLQYFIIKVNAITMPKNTTTKSTTQD
ncbi:MAG: hypothetical protein COA45_07650 [Zetaproteobacteria bacterium]|nr:MAG: hypothetical protein COA45_07650 [Zetaproteobacteria bacterium]